MLAISSRRNRTSSCSSPSRVLVSAGASRRRASALPSAALVVSVDVERVPVEMTLIVLVGDENALRRRGVGTLHGAGELVFEKTRRPRIIGGGFGRAIQAARPRQELRCRVLERGFLACIQTGEGI